MTSAATAAPVSATTSTPVPLILGGLAFVVAFAEPAASLTRDWWTDPNAGHGLLLVPVALWLAWKRGLVTERQPWPALGLGLLAAALLLRFLSGLAAELFTMRASMLGAAAGLIIYTLGVRQLMRWWLPVLLILLSVPLPEVLLNSLALPLQLRASAWGATLLSLRHVPVRLSGNIIQLPGRSLFVTEACSGLRSLTALLALGLLVGGLWLRKPWSRVVLVIVVLPVAMLLNAVRVFLTGFFVFYVDPRLAEGVMHLTEGWVIFVCAMVILAAVTWVLARVEARLAGKLA